MESLEDLKSVHVLNHKNNHMHKWLPTYSSKKDEEGRRETMGFSLHAFLWTLDLLHISSLLDYFLKMKNIIIIIKNVWLNPYGPFPYVFI